MIERDYVLKYLQDKQKTEGGYTGNDLTVFAEQLSEGTFPVDTNFLRDLSTTDIEASDDEVPPSWTNLSDILKEVSLYVRTVNTSWFSEHQQLFKMQTDDLFSMEYAEVDFAERLYIGHRLRNDIVSTNIVL